jgi:hypothetical protein
MSIASVGSSSTLLFSQVEASDFDSADDAAPDPGTGTAAVAGQDGALLADSPAISPLADLRSQIETAVTSAVAQLPDGSSPQDLFRAIRSAVEETLKANGLNPRQLAGHHGGHHHRQAQNVSADLGGAAGGDQDSSSTQHANADPLLAGDPSAAPTASGVALFAAGPNATDALAALVQQLSGSDNSQPGQIGSQSTSQSTPFSSLLPALQGSSAGGTDLTAVFQALFQNFPNGTGLDVRI